MARLLRSSNGARRTDGVEMAVGLGTDALPELHDLMGHARREVRNAVATALATIGDERSVPLLAAGLHGNSMKASTFRPAVDVAAKALSQYPVANRTEVLRELDQPIKPDHLVVLLEGFDSDAAFAAVDHLHSHELLLLDYSETPLELLVAIDEPKAWPRVRRQASTLSGWTLARLLPRLSLEHQLELVREWMGTRPNESWDWDAMVKAIVRISALNDDLRPVLEELHGRLDEYPGQARKQAEHRHHVTQRLGELRGSKPP